MYHPQPEVSPSYDEYADPATAHGWQNAYDETTKLPPVVDEDHGAADAATGGTAGPGGYREVDGFRQERGRRVGGAGRGSRRKPSAWRSRRVAMAAGAVGAVSAAALIAGFSLSGSSAGGTQGEDDRTSPTAKDPADLTGPSEGPSASVRSSDGTDPARPGSPDASASPSGAEDSDDEPAESSPGPATATAPTPTAPTTSPAPAETDDKPGRGQGNPKRPK
ncbi:hypothetical protein IM697_38925 [Streptomyces ferrugineus]|uniref:Uncharacterized protein n=1 Tax=Streptomyces ferrugineus TaxID=1413221 RepID=A0A7M2T139_9ACTN|nr:hypothetical protein IM697_38925 [Streptomyces ferrugineus]